MAHKEPLVQERKAQQVRKERLVHREQLVLRERLARVLREQLAHKVHKV
jgi:hypothetical protein